MKNYIGAILYSGLLIPSYLFAQYTKNDWGVYFGGAKDEYLEEVAVDSGGNALIVGRTKSTSGVATALAHQTVYGGGPSDAFLAKYDPDGHLLWSTYFGGAGKDNAFAVSVDGGDNITIGGLTNSLTGIATPGSHQSAFGGGGDDGFVAKFDPNGQLLWSTYFGGPSGEWILGIAHDAASNVYVTGFTGSASGIATAGAYQDTFVGKPMDCFWAKLDPNGVVAFSTYFGAVGEDRPHDIQVDPLGNVILAGTTPSKTGMATAGAYQETMAGAVDAFVSKWTGGGQLIWSTYYGGTLADRGRECYTDSEGSIYLTGFTQSSSGIATAGTYQELITPASGGGIPSQEAYLVKFDTNGQRIWGTYFGGTGNEYGRGLRITQDHRVVISGATGSATQIASADAYQPHKGGGSDAYLAVFSTDGAYLGSTYYGGAGAEPYQTASYGPAVAIDAQGNVYLSPTSSSTDLPALNGPAGGYDAVLTKFAAAIP
ncbi:MAG: SBBP repeat-containing protein [Acidobacteriota bacterium]